MQRNQQPRLATKKVQQIHKITRTSTNFESTVLEIKRITPNAKNITLQYASPTGWIVVSYILEAEYLTFA